jgi:hypothetical protein
LNGPAAVAKVTERLRISRRGMTRLGKVCCVLLY